MLAADEQELASRRGNGRVRPERCFIRGDLWQRKSPYQGRGSLHRESDWTEGMSKPKWVARLL